MPNKVNKNISLLKIEIQTLTKENLYLKNKIMKCHKHCTLQDTLISDFSNGCFNNIEFMQVEIERSLKSLDNNSRTNLEKESKALILLLKKMILILKIQKETYTWKKNVYI